jgi:hypothetical protein
VVYGAQRLCEKPHCCLMRCRFQLYGRTRGTLDSSGFEHVFVGEIKGKGDGPSPLCMRHQVTWWASAAAADSRTSREGVARLFRMQHQVTRCARHRHGGVRLRVWYVLVPQRAR